MSDRPYVCSDCGASGVKLWRLYQTFMNANRFTCRACTVRRTGTDMFPLDCDSYGWYVPAVPVGDGTDACWGYSSVPQDRVEWWKGLP